MIEEKGLIRDIKDCAVDVLSEIEEPLSKQPIFDEHPSEVNNIQHCLDMPNMERNVLCYEQLVMAETCKNELEISHDLPKVTPSKDGEFNLVEEKEDEIRKKLPTYDKVFLQAFILKDDFTSCLLIVESNGVSEVVLKNRFNYDISSNMQANFEMILS